MAMGICGGDDAERERERVELVKLLPFWYLSFSVFLFLCVNDVKSILSLSLSLQGQSNFLSPLSLLLWVKKKKKGLRLSFF